MGGRTLAKKNFLGSCLSYKCHYTPFFFSFFFFLFFNFTRIPLLFLGEKLGFFRANLAMVLEVGGGGGGIFSLGGAGS